MKHVTLPEDIISDFEVEKVHANANFGSVSPRQVIDEGVTKYAFGYTTGHTMFTILVEHKLIRRSKNLTSYKASLTPKGKKYLKALYPGDMIYDILKLKEEYHNENMCESCGQYHVSFPYIICEGCEAYREHQQ